MKKTSDYILWALLAGVIIAIAIQCDWEAQVFSSNSNAIQIVPAPQSDILHASSPTKLSIELSKSHLTVERQHHYTVDIDAVGHAAIPINWRYQTIDEVDVSIKNNTLHIVVKDITFKRAMLKVTFYNDSMSIEKTLLLINVGDAPQHIEAPPTTQQNSQDIPISSYLSGNIMYERLSFIESTNDDITSYKFTPDNPHLHPVRFMRINLRDANDSIVAQSYTDEVGRYQFDINTYAQSADFYIEVVSQMMLVDASKIRSFARVINQGSAYPENTTYRRLYHATSPVFRVISGDNQQDMRLNTGWHSTLREFEPQHSIAQPFAILDTLAKGFVYLQENSIELPKRQEMLTVTWSQDPDISQSTTGYYDSTNNIIFISGNNAQDTEQKPISTISEWNEHTILHEFGHFYLKKIVGRDDTQAGQHTAFGFGSLTLALSEGLANSLAKTILKDWQDKRVNFDIDKQRFVTNTLAILSNETSHIKHNLVNQAGAGYQRPRFDFSPFIEETVSYFILSIIDPRSQYSARTTKLSDDIGMYGLHQALSVSAQSDALMTIYSLAQALKIQNPNKDYLIDELGLQLDLNFHDRWGNAQQPLNAHIIGHNELLLPSTAHYPFYQPIRFDQPNDIAFNGALQSLSSKRPGTLRYQTFVAPKDGTIIINIPDVIDEERNIHQFSFNVVQQGEIVAGSFYSEDNELTYGVLNVEKDKRYIIRTFDELFNNKDIKSEHTVTTNLVISYR